LALHSIKFERFKKKKKPFSCDTRQVLIGHSLGMMGKKVDSDAGHLQNEM
jgi:hypothetical protein